MNPISDATSEPIIQVRGLVKKHGDFTVVDNVVDNISFVVQRGKIFGIVGPYGTGKTSVIEPVM